MIQAGDLEDGNKVVDKFSGSYFSQEVITPILDAYVCELEAEMRDGCRRTRRVLTLRARICTFGFLWLRRRLSARMASFAGADFERIWSHISRLSATSSAPAGISSEVALSEAGQCQHVLDVCDHEDGAHRRPRRSETLPRASWSVTMPWLYASITAERTAAACRGSCGDIQAPTQKYQWCRSRRLSFLLHCVTE